jgi:hypothetical protein
VSLTTGVCRVCRQLPPRRGMTTLGTIGRCLHTPHSKPPPSRVAGRSLTGLDTRGLEGTRRRRDHRPQPPTAAVAAASHRRLASSSSARPSTKCPTEPARTAPDPISPPKAITQRFALGRDLWSHAPNAPPHAPLTRSTHLTQRSSTRRQRHLAARRGDHPHRTNAGSSVRGWWLPRPRA